MKPDINKRARDLLEILISQYIRDGKPVGSRTLSRQSGLSLSPATIRNVMADLEDAGLIAAPHTSAGRIPTSQGYRFFVDTLVTAHERQAGSRGVESSMVDSSGTAKAVESTSNLLSALTNFVGVVTVPKRESFAFRHIDFVTLSDTQVLAILVFADGEVQNRLLTTDRRFSQPELERAANFLNSEYSGMRLPEIKARLIDHMATSKQQMDELMQAAIDVARNAFSKGQRADVVVSGQTNLMQHADFGDLNKLRTLFEAFQEKREILFLLEECVGANGVRLFIGEESGSEALDACSVVSAPYQAGDEVVGVLGVIGPTRMAYDHVISVVEATAEVLSSVLNQKR